MDETTARHTPGPWHTPGRTHGTRYVEARIGGGMLQEVAACGPTEVLTQQEANARLIAAAPDLLAALEELMYARTDKAEKMARAALAKAVGAAQRRS